MHTHISVIYPSVKRRHKCEKKQKGIKRSEIQFSIVVTYKISNITSGLIQSPE